MDKESGLYDKYQVRQVHGGQRIEGFFVLRPNRDPTALAALIHYAALTPNKQLAADLEEWIERIQR